MKKALFTIVYEDQFMVAVNKAAGIAVGGDRWDDTRERLDKLLPYSVFTVHRIDRDTSGLVLFAKDEETHKKLNAAFEGRQAQKQYVAVVQGRPAWGETSCELPLVLNGDKQHRTIVDKYQGKKSFTAFRFVLSAGNYSVVEAMPTTGRTHQIRVHLASLGHPVVCDPLYGKNSKPALLSSFKRGWQGDLFEERPLLERLGLHARSLVIPRLFLAQGEADLALSAPLAHDMDALITQMGKAGRGRIYA